MNALPLPPPCDGCGQLRPAADVGGLRLCEACLDEREAQVEEPGCLVSLAEVLALLAVLAAALLALSEKQ